MLSGKETRQRSRQTQHDKIYILDTFLNNMENEKPKYVDEMIRVMAKYGGSGDLALIAPNIRGVTDPDELIPARDYLFDKGLIRKTKDPTGRRGHEHPFESYEFTYSFAR